MDSTIVVALAQAVNRDRIFGVARKYVGGSINESAHNILKSFGSSKWVFRISV